VGSLDDSTAKELITTTVARFVDNEIFRMLEDEQTQITHTVKAKLTAALLL
jgi:hypothetical protein